MLKRSKVRQRCARVVAVVAALALVTTACAEDSADPESASDAASDGDTESDDEGTSTGDDAVATDSECNEISLQIAHVVTPDEPTNVVVEELAARINERTDGMVSFEVFPSSQLGSGQEVLEQAASGGSVITFNAPDAWAEYGVPELAVSLSPFLVNDADSARALTKSDLWQEWFARLEASNLRVLSANWYFGERHLIANAGFPQPEDLDGSSIRVPPNPVWVNTFEVLPSTPVTLEWAEVYTGLSQGTVDIAEAPLASLYAASLHEVADTVTLTSHIKQVNGWAMSDDVFTGMCPEFQEIFLDEFDKGGDDMSALTKEAEQTVRADLEDVGVTFIDADRDAYREAVTAFYDRFDEWPDDILDQVNDAVEQVGG